MHPLKQLIYRLLRKSEKYTKTDMVYAASSGFWVTAGQVAATLFSIPLSIAFGHYLSQNDFGIYKYVLSVGAVISVFSLTGVGTALARAAARGFDGSLAQTFWLSLKGSILSILIALGAAGYYFYNENIVLGVSLIIIALLSPLFNASYLFGSYLNGKKDFKRSTQYNTWRNLFSSVCILTTILLFPNPLAILLVYFSSYTVSGLIATLYTYRATVRNEKEDPEIGKFSLHLSFISGLSVLADRLDGILLFQMIGAKELAIYSFAEIIPEAINRFTKSVGSVAFPKFALQKRPVGLIRKTIILSLLFVPVVLAYWIAAPYIFALFFPAYMESVALSQVLVLLLLFSGVLPGTYIDAQRALKRRYLINIVNSSVKIGLTILGILFFGLWGAVLARVLAKILNTSFTLCVCLWKWN